MLEKIDIHCHTSNRILKEFVNTDISINAIEKQMDNFNISKTCLLATYFSHKGSGISNFRLLKWINNSDKFYLFGSLDFTNYFYAGYNELDELIALKKLNGIKIYTTYQHIDLYSDNMTKLLKLAEQYNLPVMFHTGCSNSRASLGRDFVVEEVFAKKLEFLIKKFNINFILAHLGKPQIDQTINVIKNNKNVYTDISGLINSLEKNEIKYFINKVRKLLLECGPEQILFGTDFPVQSHEDSVRIINDSMFDFSINDQKKVFYENAFKIIKHY